METPTPQPKARVLIVDDDPLCCRHLERLLAYEGYDSLCASNAQDALALVEKSDVDVVITDLCMPDLCGTDLIRCIGEKKPNLPCILVTGFGTAERAVEALRAGAFWYLPKPFEGGSKTVARLVARAIEHRRIRSKRAGRTGATGGTKGVQIVGTSPAIHDVLDQAKRVAPLDTTILLSGESGTGKDLIAQSIHAQSPRRNKPFIAVNCGAIPEDLLESELFGHIKGAFTHATENRTGRFSSADGGTIFLDEVGDMSPRFQVKMLRVLQTGEFQAVGSSKTQRVDVRILAATNQDLRVAADDGRFREDLYYRLAVIPIHLPALRERPEDIPLLVDFFAERFREISGFEVPGISSTAIDMLQRYAWPGNVRELENIVERLLVLCDGREVGASDLPPELCMPSVSHIEPSEIANLSFKKAVQAFESDLLIRALDDNNWNKSAAAEALGIKRTTLVDMIRRKNLAEYTPGPQAD